MTLLAFVFGRASRSIIVIVHNAPTWELGAGVDEEKGIYNLIESKKPF